MIRRWSYINSVNSLNSRVKAYSVDLARASFDLNVNSTMYLHKYYSPATKICRRRWARRRHIYNLVPLTNIISAWAKYYRNTRNHTKAIMSQDFFGHSFVAFNFVSVMNSVPAVHKGLENFIISPYTRRMLTYFKIYGNPRLKFLLTRKHVAISTISIYKLQKNFNLLEDTPAAGALLYDGGTGFVGWDEVTPSSRLNSVQLFTSLAQLSFANWWAKVISLYKTLILLTLRHLK